MIIWLASYPKSGNTWIRLFLDSLFSSSKEFNINQNYITQFPLRKHFEGIAKNINDQSEFAKNCVNAQSKLNIDNKIKILKTHNALWNFNNGKYSFTDENNTLGVIHIVRDPRSIVTSILNYFHKDSYESAIEFMTTDKVLGGGDDESGLPTIVGSWVNHYKSWKKFKKNYLLIKYEDLLENPEEEFFKITNFLTTIGNYKFNENEILEIIKKCKFEEFSKQEEIKGFTDNPLRNRKLNKKFFKLGPKNNWRNLLEPKIQLNIEKAFQKEMKELGYL